MKLGKALLVCFALVAECLAFVLESDGLQSWGGLDAPTHWERADTAASEIAAWMPKSNKRRRVDIEFEHRHIQGHSAQEKASQTSSVQNGGMMGNVVPVAKWFEEAHSPLPREVPGVPETVLSKQRRQPSTDLPAEEEPALTSAVQPTHVVKAGLKPRFSPEPFARGTEEPPVSEPTSAENASPSAFKRTVQETAAWAAKPNRFAHRVLERSLKTSNEIPLEVANSAGGDEGPEVAHTTRTVAAAHELQKALRKLKTEIPLRTASNVKQDEGPEVGQIVRRVTVANATGHLQKLTKGPSNVSEPAELTKRASPLLAASADPLKQLPSNQLPHREDIAGSAENETLSAALACVCGGTFKEGERVKYTGRAFPPGRTIGTILGGTNNGLLNVEWDNFATGHTGNCKVTTCGSCIESPVKSRWFTSCKDLTTDELAASTTTAPPLLSAPVAPLEQSPGNHPVRRQEIAVSSANGASSTALTCVCGGAFKEGERVKYTGHAFPPGRTFGTILGGTNNDFLNVEWDNFATGHTGNCKLTTCGACIESPMKSRWFTACKDLVSEDAASAKVSHTTP